MSNINIIDVGKDQAYIGFSDFHIGVIAQNDDDGYEVGDVYSLPYVQSIDPPDDEGDETEIYADDEIFLSGGKKTTRNRMITVAQMDINRLALFSGATIQADGSMRRSFGKGNARPQIACSWSHMLSNDGGWQGVKMYAADIVRVSETQITTNDGTTKIAAWNITFTFADRRYDGTAEDRKNFTERTELTAWLGDYPAAP